MKAVNDNSRPNAGRKKPSVELEPDPDAVDRIRASAALSVPKLGHSLAYHPMSIGYVRNKFDGFQPLRNVPLGGIFQAFLSEHREQSKKDLHGLIYGNGLGYRTDVCFETVDALTYDIDNTGKYNAVCDAFKEFGCASVVYTTFNHGRSRQKLQDKEFAALLARRKKFPSVPVSDEEVAEFCASISKYSELKNVTVLHEGKIQDAVENPHFEMQHDPEEKSRSILFLKKPIPLAVVGQDGFRAIYHAVGTTILDTISYDKSCENPSRIHWTPAKPLRSSVGHSVEVFKGELFDWEVIWNEIKTDIEKRRLETIKLSEARRQAREMAGAEGVAAQVAQCLDHIPASIEYKKWFSALAAIHNETDGSDAGRSLAHEWSMRAPELYDESRVDKIWDGLERDQRADRKASMGTLIFLARENCPEFCPGRTGAKYKKSNAAAYAKMVREMGVSP
ncbi:PriCT-2 domain-containing protein [Hyphomicrobium facile]|uniref:Primase C terminal 2 (PriCT-2) n=1 Tax=Hyphomicrobium facile TaxID=51670 RepID=A0A1I7NE27_9HYPH|nr:PriCT-2 domain-containing protein [Hyphomicrobium facile]SFV32938.1 Primase C terminal 2 (PriCT-2) [Hyphomicrobium facile]